MNKNVQTAGLMMATAIANSHNPPATPSPAFIAKGSAAYFDAREAKVSELLDAAKRAEAAVKARLEAELEPFYEERKQVVEEMDGVKGELVQIDAAVLEGEKEIADKRAQIAALNEQIEALERAKKVAVTALRPDTEAELAELVSKLSRIDSDIGSVRKMNHRQLHRSERDTEKLSARLVRVRARRPKNL